MADLMGGCDFDRFWESVERWSESTFLVIFMFAMFHLLGKLSCSLSLMEICNRTR